MPSYELFAPVGATNLKLVNRGRDIPIDPDSICINRVGEDGTLQIIPIFAGTEYVGVVLDGEFVKGWDANMDADQTFTAILDGSGVLQFQGEADAAGTEGKGWINSKNGIPLMHELGVTVSLELPVDTSGAVADRDLGFDFFLRRDKVTTVPDGDDDYLAIRNYVPEYVAGSTPAYTELMATITGAALAGSAWTNYDIFTNDSVPKGALVEIYANNLRDAANATLGVRKDGSALDRYHVFDDADGAQGGNGCTFRVIVDVTTGLVELYDDEVDNDFEYVVLGYWADMPFEEKWQTVTAIGTNAYESVTVDATYIDRVGSFHWVNDKNSKSYMGMRRTSSILLRRLNIDNAQNSGSTVCWEISTKLDGNGDVEIYVPDTTNCYFILEGYFGVNMDYGEGYNDKVMWTAGAWVDKDYSAQGSAGDYLELTPMWRGNSTTGGTRGTRVDGSAVARLADIRVPINATGSCGATFTTKVGAAGVIELNQETLTDDHCFYWGTFIPSAVAASGGMYIKVEESVANVVTALHTSPNYIDGEDPASGNYEGQIWRFEFNDGDPSETGVEADRHVHLYLKQAATIADAEFAKEYELTSSPYDISDYLFDWAYPAYELRSENTTYFDSTSEAKTGYLRVDIPNFRLAYDPPTNADRMKNECEIWDGDPDTTGIKVYDVDHAFSGIPYIKNGLIYFTLPNSSGGIQIKHWRIGTSAWESCMNQYWYRLTATVQNCQYCSLQKIVSMSPEKIVLKVRWKDDATEDDDYYIEAYVTLKRGQYYIETELIGTYPIEDIFAQNYIASGSHIAYVGDKTNIADKDLLISVGNSTMSDNFMEHFDEATIQCIPFMASNKKPDTRLYSYQADLLRLEDIKATQVDGCKVYVGYTPFPLIASLFAEAEDATLGGGATVVDPDALASGLKSVLLNAASEYVGYEFTAVTDLPTGRYLAVFRAKDTNQIASDLRIYVWNSTDGVVMNEENAFVWKTLTATYAYYSIVFDINEADSGDTVRPTAFKSTATANDIYVDYILLVPIGDGESFPQDLAHNAIYKVEQKRRLLLR